MNSRNVEHLGLRRSLRQWAVALAAAAVGPLLNELKLGALSTAVSAVLAFAAARLLHVGRFARKSRKWSHSGHASHATVTGATR
jgi:ABC-type spermidine/putrescine transport system permease subunit II